MMLQWTWQERKKEPGYFIKITIMSRVQRTSNQRTRLSVSSLQCSAGSRGDQKMRLVKLWMGDHPANKIYQLFPRIDCNLTIGVGGCSWLITSTWFITCRRGGCVFPSSVSLTSFTAQWHCHGNRLCLLLAESEYSNSLLTESGWCGYLELLKAPQTTTIYRRRDNKTVW